MNRASVSPAGRSASIGLKLALTMGAVVAVASALVFVELSQREHESILLQKTTAAAMVADLFAVSLAAPLDFGDADAVEVELKKLQTSLDVVDALVWNAEDRPVGALHAAAADAPAALPSDREHARVTVLEDRVEVVRLVSGHDGKRLGGALLSLSLAGENAAWAASRARVFWLCFGLAVGTMALLVAIVRRQIVSPLERLGSAAKRLEQGDAGASVTVGARDEIGRLAVAFNAMSAAIADREQRLAAANHSIRELFDHMRQAIVVFGPDGLVGEESSRQATVIFGGASLEGRAITELLYPEAEAWTPERQALGEWIALAFEIPFSAWDELRAMAPREVLLHAGAPEERDLELDFQPVLEDGKIARVMLLATDITDKRGLERAARAQGEAHERQLAAMRRLVTGGAQVFVSFLEISKTRIARCEELLAAAAGELRLGTVEEVFQHVHTMKGEAQAFDLLDLAGHLASFEEKLREARRRAKAGEAAAAAERADFAAAVSRAGALVGEGEARFVAASPIGRSALDQITVRRADVARLRELCGDKVGELGAVVARLAARPFGEGVVNLGEKVPTWAEHEEKRAALVIEGRDVLVPPDLGGVLGGVVTQLVRNAIAHGVERPEERVRLGKDPVAVIHVRCAEGPGGPSIVVSDDGRGLVEAAVRTSAAEIGVVAEADAHELIFAPGLSTMSEPSTLAGHGVGLAAAKAELAQVGYEIVVESKAGLGARFTLHPTRTPPQRTDRSKEPWKKAESSSSTTAGSSSRR